MLVANSSVSFSIIRSRNRLFIIQLRIRIRVLLPGARKGPAFPLFAPLT